MEGTHDNKVAESDGQWITFSTTSGDVVVLNIATIAQASYNKNADTTFVETLSGSKYVSRGKAVYNIFCKEAMQ